jgi:multidrug efflux pump subunit AcrA (membrane-fusion protein)
VPEADIAKIKIGDSAKVTLDAYGSDTYFPARVTKIDPAETMVEGVATYKAILQFAENDQRIRSGMTANMDIETAKKEGVLVVPQRAVIRKIDGSYRVQIFKDEQTSEERTVAVGLRGSDGNIEVVSGLSEGEKIFSIPK